jgi:2-hydroxychromene-2-carboxylate isomerase
MFFKHIDISQPENLIKLLAEDGYSKAEIEKIMAAVKTPEMKKALSDRTQEALDRGAFGAPWFYVRNSKGVEEPFFGSDRLVFDLVG